MNSNQMMTPPTNKLHYYMATTQLFYERDSEIMVDDGSVEKTSVMKTRTMNIVLSNTKKAVDYNLINQGRIATLQRAADEMQVGPELIRDFVYLNISYLGFMSPEVFNGEEANKKKKRKSH